MCVIAALLSAEVSRCQRQFWPLPLVMRAARWWLHFR